MPGAVSTDDQKILDILRLSDAQWRKLADTLRKNTTHQATVEKRRHDRVEFVGRIGIALKYSEHTWQKYVVFTRDISPTGLRFVHGGYLHVGAECRIVLATRTREVLCVDGVVKRCQYLQDRLHDVGVEFDAPIDIDCFVTDPARS